MRKLNLTGERLWGRQPSVRQSIVQHLLESVGVVVTRKQVIAAMQTINRTKDDVQWLFNDRRFRVGRGQYTLQPLLLEEVGSEAVGVAFDA